MQKISVISKITHHKLLETVEQKTILLSESSVVILDIKKEDILSYKIEGNELVITLRNGEILTIKNFNPNTSSLVLNDDDELLWVKFTTEHNSSLVTAVYESISNISPLLYDDLAITGLKAGGVAGLLLAGIGLGINSLSDDGADRKNTTNAAIKDTTASVEAAEKAYQDVTQAIADANKDQLITP
ncbi:BapA/Bap/LapF family prefix-like domain-containing protein, partial [Acinetobacter sp. 1125_18A]|uniref:BapA/Bap/LapF family prefix-like domain-containing protein n=1 Tax=Acinetobacter sp. 1125_18A TaxID=2605959 RepID=UPI00405949B6